MASNFAGVGDSAAWLWQQNGNTFELKKEKRP
jgi:hypothetical protein